MNTHQVPFYSNTPDNNHCYQAALKMVLKYFLPQKNYTWKELEDLTAKIEDLWTWPTQSLINLHNIGFHIVDIDDFNIERFIKIGDKYLIEKYGEEVGQSQINHSNINQEREIYRQYLKLGLHQIKLPTPANIKKLIKEGYLVICNINSRILNGKKGYTGHFIVIHGYSEREFYLHDPGLPPLKNRKVSFKLFNKAWNYPDKNYRNLIGIKY